MQKPRLSKEKLKGNITLKNRPQKRTKMKGTCRTSHACHQLQIQPRRNNYANLRRPIRPPLSTMAQPKQHTIRNIQTQVTKAHEMANVAEMSSYYTPAMEENPSCTELTHIHYPWMPQPALHSLSTPRRRPRHRPPPIPHPPPRSPSPEPPDPPVPPKTPPPPFPRPRTSARTHASRTSGQTCGRSAKTPPPPTCCSRSCTPPSAPSPGPRPAPPSAAGS